MKIPRSAPPLRGVVLRVVAWLVGFDWFRDLLLWKVRRDARITEMPDVR